MAPGRRAGRRPAGRHPVTPSPRQWGSVGGRGQGEVPHELLASSRTSGRPCVLLVRGAGSTRPVVTLCSHGPGVTSERHGIECGGPLFSSALTSEGAERDSCPRAGRPCDSGNVPFQGVSVAKGWPCLPSNTTICCLPGTLRARSRYLPIG